ncbi:hypothetical protein G6F40_014575 [Rhizopus arrhizus]|nr:hypothetical protein G6F40_014575 [Rhizopus arrhizus]
MPQGVAHAVAECQLQQARRGIHPRQRAGLHTQCQARTFGVAARIGQAGLQPVVGLDALQRLSLIGVFQAFIGQQFAHQPVEFGQIAVQPLRQARATCAIVAVLHQVQPERHPCDRRAQFMRDRVGQGALALHQLGHARGHAVGMVNDDPDLRAWRHLRPCLQVAGTDAVGMQAQRFQVAPQQADPGIQAGPDQQQDAEVGGDGHRPLASSMGNRICW